MATEIAKAYVQIIPTTKNIKGQLTQQLGGEADSAGNSAGESFGAKFASAAKKIIAAAGIGKIIKDSISFGADLEQNLGGTKAVFGDFASTIQTQAQEAYKNMGMSASEYMETANKMGSLFQGSGLEQQRALELTSAAMQRAADVASVMGLSTESAMESIAGAAKGNFTMMDNLGVAMNATTLEAYAAEKGLANFAYSTATNAEKAEIAMQMFMERTEQYQGNFARESEETISGSLNSMKSAFQNLLGNLTLGNDIAPSLNALKDTTLAFINNNMIPAFTNITNAVPEVISGLVDVLIQNMPVIAEAGVNLFISLIANLPEIVMSIVGAVPEIMTAIRDAFAARWEEMKSIGSNLFQGLKAGIANKVNEIGQEVSSWASGLLSDVKSFFGIHSPSTVFAGIGENLMLGLSKGLEDAEPAVAKAMDDINNMTADSMQSTIDVSASGVDSIMRSSASVNYKADASDVSNDVFDGVYRGMLNAMKSADFGGEFNFYLEGEKLVSYVNKKQRQMTRAMGV